MAKNENLTNHGVPTKLKSYSPRSIKEFMTLNRFDNFNQRSDKDKLMKKRKMMEEQKYYRDRRDTGIYSSRSFAIGLVGVASCYLLVMICKAYRRLSIEQETANYGISESLTYYYDTESYDWN